MNFMFWRPPSLTPKVITKYTALPRLLKDMNNEDRHILIEDKKQKVAQIYSPEIANEINDINLANDLIYLQLYTTKQKELTIEEKIQLRRYIRSIYDTTDDIPQSVQSLFVDILKKHKAIPEDF